MQERPDVYTYINNYYKDRKCIVWLIVYFNESMITIHALLFSSPYRNAINYDLVAQPSVLAHRHGVLAIACINSIAHVSSFQSQLIYGWL